MDMQSNRLILLFKPYLVLYVICFIAQTEGDPAYDYEDAYDDPFDGKEVLGIDPKFDVPLVNVTVVARQTALLPCSIKHLGNHEVTWLDPDYHPVTLKDTRVIDDSRFSIVRTYINEWNLQIREVQWRDQGSYQCTINTNPIRSKTVLLHVKVPPTIIDELSSDDETVQEGDTVVLICNVTGVPKPEVSWFRKPIHDTESKASKERKERCKPSALGPGIGPTGEMIIIKNVSRYCDDIYECQASNGVQPDVSRQIRVTVEFPPEVKIRTKVIKQERGKYTILECKITAYPQAVNIWQKNGERITSAVNTHVEAFDDEEASTISLNLHIKAVREEDYGEYTCVAMNALGRDKGKVYLGEMNACCDGESDTTKIVSVIPSNIPVINIDRHKTTTTKKYYPLPTKLNTGDPFQNIEVDRPVAGPVSRASGSKCTPQIPMIITLYLICLHYITSGH